MEDEIDRIGNAEDTIMDHEERIDKLEGKLGIKEGGDSSVFVTKKEFNDFNRTIMVPQLKTLKKGQDRIQVTITGVIIAAAIVMWLKQANII